MQRLQLLARDPSDLMQCRLQLLAWETPDLMRRLQLLAMDTPELMQRRQLLASEAPELSNTVRFRHPLSFTEMCYRFKF